MAKLAALGGKPAAKGLKLDGWPIVDKEDEKMLIKVLRGRKWCRIYPGSWAEKFEKAYAKWHDAKYAIAAANGTVTLELAMKAG